ncbi:MAG: helix-turn-helix domain-containing protein [Candidatus Pacearchaeota archaeon]|jgi:sugar-specific transcriptional regulator TrmB
MNTNVLKEIGLTDAEIKVFVELSKVESAMASEIAEKVGIYRTNTYDILESLIEKGLVSYIIKANRKHFLASKPEKLLSYLKEKEEKIKNQETQIQELIPILLSLKQSKQEELKAEIYKGKEGLKTLLNDMLNVKKEIYYLGYSAITQKILPDYFESWQRKRINLKIKRIILAKEQMRNSEAIDQPMTQIKYLPDQFNIPISIMIYEKKIWVLIPSENDHISLLIESEKMTKSFLNYFNQLWKTAKE